MVALWFMRAIEEIKLAIENKPQLIPPPEAFVTKTNPAFGNENAIGQGESIIVTPKSPQLIEWEEQEELRKLNLRKM